MVIHQTKFIKQLLKDYHLDDVSPVSSPLPSQPKLLHKMDNPLLDATIYRQLIGKLNLLLHTRPDLAFSVQHLSQFNQTPSEDHYSAAIHVLRYIKGTLSQALYFNDSKDFHLEAFCDSDWAACPITRKSVSGYYILFGGSPTSWKSKKQSTIFLSSAEAEYRSMQRVTAELSWLSRLLDELGIEEITPIPLKCDNMAVIYIASNPLVVSIDSAEEIRTENHESLSLSLSQFYFLSSLTEIGEEEGIGEKDDEESLFKEFSPPPHEFYRI
ncbi:uncharacterized mitochondrial protein AtMg00810-like [Lactuca sativa]|uniref:uncharacterized mitochondrial protein AtMg00810-like n=1 Tax=Lactuca sativa TaxID=4236 RepID=UPI001C693DE0|nr:uncharacterized mitochondrial protein AtMg00810-like [Lactuca sativa]